MSALTHPAISGALVSGAVTLLEMVVVGISRQQQTFAICCYSELFAHLTNITAGQNVLLPAMPVAGVGNVQPMVAFQAVRQHWNGGLVPLAFAHHVERH
ncbi:MAG: hypothetical protein ACT4OM_04670 [Actinomycetota bacterium]